MRHCRRTQALKTRQKNLECRALARQTLHGNRSAALLDHAVNHGQTQPGPFAHFLGREEWFKDVLQCLFIHAMAGIAHRYPNVAAGLEVAPGGLTAGDFHFPNHDHDPARPGDGVARVDHQIDQHTFDLPAVGHHLPGFGLKLRDQFDVRA